MATCTNSSADENLSRYLLDDNDEAIDLLEAEAGIRDLALEVLSRRLVEDERCRVRGLCRPFDDIQIGRASCRERV